MKDILLFEPNHERARQLIFLLHMAEIRCTLAKSPDETLNYISAQRLKIINFDLLLLGTSKGLKQDSELYAEVAGMSTVPVVSVSCDSDDCVCKSWAASVVSCTPENMLECVKQQLNGKGCRLPENLAQ